MAPFEGSGREEGADHAGGAVDARGVNIKMGDEPQPLATGLYRLRFVTHLDVDAAGVDRATAAVREYLN